MNLMQTWMQSPWMKALGWTFVHSIWQIALIGLLLYLVLKWVPTRSAHTRYTIATLALWTTLITSLSTFIIMLPEQPAITSVTGNVVMIPVSKSISMAAQLSAWLEIRMPMMLSVWLAGVALLLFRLLLSLGWVNHLRYAAFQQEELQVTLNHIIHRLKLNVTASASSSQLIQSPLTIGHLKPLILFPIGIINQLSPNEVEAILTHELAHIVRRDYLSNIIQSFIETLFYYHPVTWWISRTVRAERENRADDLAVSWCGDHLGYAKALMTIQELQVQSAPRLAVGFASRKGAMLQRIQRILNVPYKNHNQMEKTVLLSLCSLCFLAFTLSGQPHNQQRKEKLNIPVALTISNESTADSIPSSGTYKIHKKTDNQDISVEVKDGDIKELKVDGKDIAPSEYDHYGKVIDDLFGAITSPPSMEGFPSPEMPAMPGVPPLPPSPPMQGYSFMMPPMPPMSPMPNMPEIELKGLDDLDHRWMGAYGDGAQINIFNGDSDFVFRIIQDTMINGNKQIMIITGKDTTAICTPAWSWSGEGPAAIALDGRMMNEEEMKKWQEEWQRNAEQWEQQWKDQADQWKDYSKQYQQQWKNDQEKWRQEKDRYREQQKQYKNMEPYFEWQDRDENNRRDDARQLEDEIRHNQYFFSPSPRLSLSEQMVSDGLIEPGQEAQVLLTPDKMKINGHKVSEEVHDKYLKLYERQQGVELSGNSRVEFTTKSKQHM